MLKRSLDIFLILVFLPILILIFFLISLIILISQGRPVIFKQKRCGHYCKEFIIYKFRTMKMKNKENEKSDQKRITKIGRILRLTSLDEIPSVYNVIVGNMTLVGPRPLLPEYLEHYTEYQNKRHNVKPGITGYAQINGRNKLKWNEKFKLDVYYVENQSIFLDIKILILTDFKIFLIKENQYNNDATMYKFSGKKDD